MPWQAYFLGLLGAPASPNSVRVCDLWASSEGVLADNNPFACSGKYPGATHCIAQCGTSSEVWAYDTIEHGCEANAAFLQGSFYVEVLAKFRADAGEQAIYDAINQSPWCSGCQNGHYPIDLYDWLQSNPPPDNPPTEEGENVTSFIAGNQKHVFALVNGVVFHWWQDSDSNTWNKEQLP